MFQFKYARLEQELTQVDFRIREILLPIFALVCAKHCQPTLVITSIYRKGDAGVHGDWRGVDVRNPWKEDLALAEGIGEWINARFAYGLTGAGKPTEVCIIGKLDPRGKHDDHFHFQVPGPLSRTGTLSIRGVLRDDEAGR